MNESKDTCANCWKPTGICICPTVPKIPVAPRVLVLQHPQEARNPLSTARMVSLALPHAVHRVGFSWGSLRRALGDDADPSRWAVLFVGTKKNFKSPKPFQMVNSRGNDVSGSGLEGIVVLDGTWKQSKTLWWRNSWLLKLKRISLKINRPSLLGAIRNQPRSECLCTLEAVAETLRALGDNDVADQLLNFLNHHIDQINDWQRAQKTQGGRVPQQALNSPPDGKTHHHSGDHRGGARQEQVSVPSHNA